MRILLALISLLLISAGAVSCKDSATPTDDEDLNQFQIDFTRQFLRGDGFVVLHSADGTEYMDHTAVNGDVNWNYGETPESRLSVTIVDIYEPSVDTQDIIIRTYLNTEAGDWRARGSEFYDQGTVHVNVRFPEDNYDSVLGSVTSFGKKAIPSALDTSYLFSDLEITQSNSGLTTAYGAVWNADSSAGLCNWILDEPFSEDGSTTFDLDLVRPLERATISATRIFESCSIYRVRGTEFLTNWMYSSGIIAATETHEVLYSPEFPGENFMIRLNYVDGDIGYSFQGIEDTLQTNMTIPIATIDATYHDFFQQFDNITINGIADEVRCLATLVAGNHTVFWYVYVDTETRTVPLPTLPDEVLAAFDSSIDLSQLTGESIRLFDYNTAEKYDEIQDMRFKVDAPFVALYEQRYTYWKEF